ncbi:unnamed protein product [Aphanomyces euteiches]|uniref:Uncharacterized protein n=1 Tax=Aphanomyces euteiches TaxID=100861 RepID=A0A6G0XG10_9STRA|nr:hypothetical protein Ae201684_005227 [Aphanomyces euteiches]KAH9053415.1 hypothetical protein Ae201684P_015185 [Aphanomyces euteiches]KAH9134358.1 hypothetical protein AeRB84_019811 [Aphanomyces euteiches]
MKKRKLEAMELEKQTRRQAKENQRQKELAEKMERREKKQQREQEKEALRMARKARKQKEQEEINAAKVLRRQEKKQRQQAEEKRQEEERALKKQIKDANRATKAKEAAKRESEFRALVSRVANTEKQLAAEANDVKELAQNVAYLATAVKSLLAENTSLVKLARENKKTASDRTSKLKKAIGAVKDAIITSTDALQVSIKELRGRDEREHLTTPPVNRALSVDEDNSASDMFDIVDSTAPLVEEISDAGDPIGFGASLALDLIQQARAKKTRKQHQVL